MADRSVRILHVDDLEEDFILVRELLSMAQGMKFDFRWVSNVRTAAQLISETSFDICLVDYYVGIENGLEFIRNSIANGVTVPFILMSGQKDYAIEREALGVGARQCIDKNEMNTAVLVKAIQDVVME